MFIKDMGVGDRVESFYLLANAAVKKTANGRPFLTMVLSDMTGSVDGQVWDYAGPVTPNDVGQVIKILGTVTEYKGIRQITVERLRLAQPDDRYNAASLVPSAPIDVDAAFRELMGFVESISDNDYKNVCVDLLDIYYEDFITTPAAKSVHHAFLNGLLMHTLYMAKIADFMAGLYGELLDRSLLLAGTILHDIAKCAEFTRSPLGMVVEYSMEGQLLGHLVMGAEWVAQSCRKLDVPYEKEVLLRHMILSHHGEPEFGAAVLPSCAESELLSYIDMIDSRMEIYRETFNETPVGEFSKRVFALEKRVYNHKK